MTATTNTSIQPFTANTVIHGGCIDIMRGLETGSVDMVLTDPPISPDIARVTGRR